MFKPALQGTRMTPYFGGSGSQARTGCEVGDKCREGCGVGDIGALLGGGGAAGFAPPSGAVGGGLSVAFHLAATHLAAGLVLRH